MSDEEFLAWAYRTMKRMKGIIYRLDLPEETKQEIYHREWEEWYERLKNIKPMPKSEPHPELEANTYLPVNVHVCFPYTGFHVGGAEGYFCQCGRSVITKTFPSDGYRPSTFCPYYKHCWNGMSHDFLTHSNVCSGNYEHCIKHRKTKEILET